MAVGLALVVLGLLAAFSPEGEELFTTPVGSPGTDKLFISRLGN